MSSKNRLKKLVLPSRVNKKVENTNLKQTITKAFEKEDQHVDGEFECPLCFELLKPPFPRLLNRLIETVRKNEQEFNQEQEKRHALIVSQSIEQGTIPPPFIKKKPGISKNDQNRICRMHKVELELKPLGIKRGYPSSIQFEKIPERINVFKDELKGIIEGRIKSDYLDRVLASYDELGSTKARQMTAVMDRFEESLPGYYGHRGSFYIMEKLNQVFLKTNELDKTKSSPLTPIEYIQQVLVPETGIRLIKQDLNLMDLNDASKVMKESTEYGSIVYNKIKKK
ncbi:RTC4-like domain-containing protein [Pilaira anomala]|nr:RTC4-like domain-containing protein [Pilaira anomala]